MSSNGSFQEQLRAVASQWGVSINEAEQKDSAPNHSRAHASKSKGGSNPRRPREQREGQSRKIASPHKSHRESRESHEQFSSHKPKWLEYAQYGVELLKVYFPAAFKEMNAVVPLKKGIKEDLVKRLGAIDTIVIEDKACMVKSLAYYVNTASYHRAMVSGVNRIDLDGLSIDIVTEEEARYAKERLEGKHRVKQAAPVQSQDTHSEK